MASTIPQMLNSVVAKLYRIQFPVDEAARLELIRTAMLDELVVMGRGARVKLSKIWIRVYYTPDVETLWYLRTDLFHLMADFHGEALALQRMNSLTDMFEGVYPPVGNVLRIRDARGARLDE